MPKWLKFVIISRHGRIIIDNGTAFVSKDIRNFDDTSNGIQFLTITPYCSSSRGQGKCLVKKNQIFCKQNRWLLESQTYNIPFLPAYKAASRHASTDKTLVLLLIHLRLQSSFIPALSKTFSHGIENNFKVYFYFLCWCRLFRRNLNASIFCSKPKYVEE